MKKSSWGYTLREIIIVIIGITIAFSMNKCSEKIKNKKLKTQYLTNLKNDIEADKLQLQKNIEAVDNKLKACSQVIPLLNTNKKQNLNLLQDVFEILKYENFSPKDITYQTLINSGDLKLIDEFKLKTAIQEHYNNYNEIRDTYTRHISLIKDHLGNYLINNSDFDQIPTGNSPFLNEVKLKNIIRGLLTTFTDKKQISLNGIKSCDKLIKEIENTLD